MADRRPFTPAHILARQYQQAVNAMAEAYSIYSCFDGPSSRSSASEILTVLSRLGNAPGARVVMPIPGTWRLARRRRCAP